MNFGLRSAFSKGLQSAFSEGPEPGLGPLYKVCQGEYANLACSITLLWSEGIIFSPVIYSYLSIFADDNADMFAASLLIQYCSFLSLILLSIGI